jgi:hypothetical protein
MRVFVVSAIALCLGSGCAASGASSDVGVAGNGGSGGQPNTDGSPTSLQFEMVPDLPARAQLQLTVRALPAKQYHVRFALPTSAGDPLDAVLDQADVDTDASGIASVQLTAPSSITSFDVRASVGSVSTSVTIHVKDTGFASLQVRPIYSGFRTIPTWVASAYPDRTCADLSGIPPADGPIVSLPASAQAAPQLNDVPAGTRLAVTLRAGHFVGGCASLEGVPPGSADKPEEVQVTVLDRPIDLSASPLNVSFSLPSGEKTWSEFLQGGADASLQALRGTSTSDVDALLDAMREASLDSLQAFENTRQAEGWDSLVAQRWGNDADSKLHDLCANWLAAGRQKFTASEHVFTGSLLPILQPGSPLDQRGAELTLLTVADVDAQKSGFVARAQVSWSASSDDSLLLGTDLYLIQSQLALALAEAAELESHTDATSGASLLADMLDCQGIAGDLAAAGPDPDFAYGDCDGACLASLCESGVSAIWRRSGDATGLSPARLSISATGAARVGDTAEVAGVSGTWLGSLKSGGSTLMTGGVLTAVAPATP